MSVPHHAESTPDVPFGRDIPAGTSGPADPADPEGPPTPPVTPASPEEPTRRPPHTRTGAAWTAVCVGALLLVLLIIFVAQNTRSVVVTFLWMEGSVSLAVALLIAGVGTGILTALVAVARMIQLRRFARRHH